MPKRKSAKGFADDIGKDLRSEIDIQYNQLIKETINDLTFGVKGRAVSPVLTGFFASSWKADVNRIARTDTPKGTEWEKIKYRHTGGARLLPGYRPLIKQRYPVPTIFSREKPVFIGNTTRYAPYAVVSKKSRINAYLQGGGVGGDSMTTKIERFFSDKGPDIRLGGSSTVIPNTNPVQRRISYTKL